MIMKVVHCSTSITNSSAVTRLHRALIKQGIDSSIITLHNVDEIENTEVFSTNILDECFHHYHEAIENFYMKKRYNIPSDIPFCFGRVGYELSKEKRIREADVIHLHWVSGNFLSVRSINHILELEKPVVWTLHDSWTLTGGCHVKLGCENYRKECGDCPFLNSANVHDESYRVMKVKEKLFKHPNLILIAPSKWMLENIKNSMIFKNVTAFQIPNTLDTGTFRAYDQNEVENKLDYKKGDEINILFGAISATTTGYKGFKYLKEALKCIARQNLEMAHKIVLHVFGEENFENIDLENYKIRCWGVVKEAKRLACIYNLADLYVFPSIDDNLPSTVMESLICATPVVCFQTGGVTDMIQHKKNGYVAVQKDVEDLANGIIWVINNNCNNSLGRAGHLLAKEFYNESRIAKLHEELYCRCINEKG